DRRDRGQDFFGVGGDTARRRELHSGRAGRNRRSTPMNADKTIRIAALTACALMCGAVSAQTKDYPTKPVRIIVPVPPGGIVDVVTRVLATKLTEVMGQSVVIDNRPGATTNIGTELAARAPGDGYTLLSNSLPLVVNPSLYAKLPFDVERDFTPVSLVASA